MSCTLALMLNTSKTVVFILMLLSYNEGKWTEVVVDKKPFPTRIDCLRHADTLPEFEEQFYWCVPELIKGEG